MNIKIVLFFITTFFLWVMSTTAIAAEILDGPAARAILQAEVQTLVYQEKYDELERMANEFRATKARFIDGIWKLSLFYNSINLESSEKNDVQCTEYINKLEKWMKKYPDSLTAKVMTAFAFLTYGWRARGNDYANTVTEEGWKLLSERVEKAYRLVKDKPGKPSDDCPGRYYMLLQVAQYQSWSKNKYDALFREAVTFEPGYHAYYIVRAHSLMQRWGGAKGEWQKFAEDAVKLTPKHEGMGIYARILRVMWNYKEFKDFKDPLVSWAKMKQGFIDMERAYLNSSYNFNSFCMFACIAEDKETARKLFQQIGNTPYTEAWKGRANFEKWRRWAMTEQEK